MEPTQIVLVPAIIATTEFLKRLHLRDYFAAILILVTASIGVLLGLLHAPGVPSVWDGLVNALAACGVITAAAKVNRG